MRRPSYSASYLVPSCIQNYATFLAISNERVEVTYVPCCQYACIYNVHNVDLIYFTNCAFTPGHDRTTAF